jgi:hypothetical protein
MGLKHYIIIGLLLTGIVNGALIRIRLTDTTENNFYRIDLYQNDSLSRRYTNTYNLSKEDMLSISAGRNYTFNFVTTKQSILYNPLNENYISYIISYLWKIFVILGLIIIITTGYYNAKSKRNK